MTLVLCGKIDVKELASLEREFPDGQRQSGKKLKTCADLH